MKDLLELGDMTAMIKNRLKKLDWLILQLLEEVSGDEAIIVGLALDTVMTAQAEIENINEYIDELRQMDTPKGVDLKRLQKVA